MLRSRRERLLRFDPPGFAVPPALRWALVRAYGPADAPWPIPPSGAEALELARRFDLASRVGGRHSLGRLGMEVGGRAAAAFALEHAAARRQAALLAELTEDVAREAARADVPVVLLKFAALLASGRVGDGLRRASDVDVLASPGRAWTLADALGHIGFAGAGYPGDEHQLPQLRDRRGRAVEIHLHVPGVRLSPGQPPATAEELEVASLLEETEYPGECRVPRPQVLAAHAVAHALSQHGFAPFGYPLFRLVADLIALGAHADGGVLARSAAPLVADDVPRSDVEACVALSARLARADATLFDAASAGSPEGVLLRHAVAGRLDADYAASLRLRGAVASPADGRWLASLLRQAWRAIVVTDAQIGVIYGPPRSRIGYLGRRLARPFDLARRAARYAAAGARLRRRRAHGER